MFGLLTLGVNGVIVTATTELVTSIWTSFIAQVQSVWSNSGQVFHADALSNLIDVQVKTRTSLSALNSI